MPHSTMNGSAKTLDATEDHEDLNQYLPSAEGSSIIPPEHYNRTLVLCFDGTGDHIVEFFSLLKKDDRQKQMVYYQAGIGTYTSRELITPLMNNISKTLDMGVAWNLHSHVMDSEGDRICIFGFSRGAYTARCLAGMIHKVGILPACNHQQVPFAYKMYSDPEFSKHDAQAFKHAFSTDVDIEFLGVWDTVDSVGLIPRHLPFTADNHIVRTFRHAVALDERRAKFKANMCHREEGEIQPEAHCHDDHPTGDDAESTGTKPKGLKKALKRTNSVDPKLAAKALKQKYSKVRDRMTNIQEVWFAGCHCDVGGGSVENNTKYTLARIPLRWMIRECFRTNSGIMFNVKLLRERLGMDPDALYPEVLERPKPLPIVPGVSVIQTREEVELAKSKPGFFSWLFGYGSKKEEEEEEEEEENNHHRDRTSSSTSTVVDESEHSETEEQRELADALSPVYDQLSISYFWWFLEVIPLLKSTSGSLRTRLGINWAHGRRIPEPMPTESVKVHRSVWMRMQAAYKNGRKYKPIAENWDQLADNVEWVE
ncbi:hypothetical protein WG66_009549 [Moniliophthora roreri]|nr:hypothetical protein WG66_009549 [Moniliophthora roreri]